MVGKHERDCPECDRSGWLLWDELTSFMALLRCRWTLKYDNIAKPFAFLCVAHFFHAFPTPEKIMLQVVGHNMAYLFGSPSQDVYTLTNVRSIDECNAGLCCLVPPFTKH